MKNHHEQLRDLLSQFNFIIESSNICKKELGKILDQQRKEYLSGLDDFISIESRKIAAPLSIKSATDYTDRRLHYYNKADFTSITPDKFVANALSSLYSGILVIRGFNNLPLTLSPLEKYAYESLQHGQKCAYDINSHIQPKCHSGKVKDGIREEKNIRRGWNGSKVVDTICSIPVPLGWKKFIKDKNLHLTDISGKKVMTLEAKKLPEKEQKFLDEDIVVYKAKVARVSYLQGKGRPALWNDTKAEYEILDRYLAEYVGEIPDDVKQTTLLSGSSFVLASSTTANRAASVLRNRIEKVICKDIWDD